MSHYLIINTEISEENDQTLGLFHFTAEKPKPNKLFKILTKVYPIVADLI